MKIPVEGREEWVLQVPFAGVIFDGTGQIFFRQDGIDGGFGFMGSAASGQIRPWREQDKPSGKDTFLFLPPAESPARMTSLAP